MLTDFFATKLGMTQAWTTQGKRVAVTKIKADDLMVISILPVVRNGETQENRKLIQLGFGQKKLKNVAKPLRSQLEKSGFSFAPLKVRGLEVEVNDDQELPKPGKTINFSEIISVGDVVNVRGTTKGRGFAGAMKRHGFHGGPATHGQSDRARAVGSIGAGTTPGRVWQGKKMPGRMGGVTETVKGLVVVYTDPLTKEIWLTGPVPGSISSLIRLTKTGQTKSIDLDRVASNLPLEVAETEEATTEEVAEAGVTEVAQQNNSKKPVANESEEAQVKEEIQAVAEEVTGSPEKDEKSPPKEAKNS